MPSRLVIVIGIVMWSAVASADTFYKYRDPKTGRDVFVNRLDQIPREHRTRAKVVMEVAAPAANEKAPEPPEAVPADEPPPPVAAPIRPSPVQDVGALFTGRNLIKDGPAAVAALVDRRLAQQGATPLDARERFQLARLFGRCAGLGLAAVVVAFVVWLVLFVRALRDGKFGWAIVMLVLWPAAYLYLFIHGGKGRIVFKLTCAAALVSPAIVGVLAATWFSRWFNLVVQARGGRV